MTRRPAVTLMEVLIAMFIMAIGMLALLALFPVGAVSMATALKDDRCAYASLMSENVAIANNVRYGDVYVFGALANLNPLVGVPNSGLVYVDPYGVYASATHIPPPPAPPPPYGFPLGISSLSAGIPRVAPTFVYSSSWPPPGWPLPAPPIGTIPLTPLIDRWFSLPDDMSFNWSGSPEPSVPFIDRGRRYSYAYLLRQQPPLWSQNQSTMKSVQLYAVVYSGRPVNSLTVDPNTFQLTGETTYIAQPGIVGANTTGTNTIVFSQGLNLNQPWPPTIKRGGWILDTTYQAFQGGPANSVNGYFYRVTNIVETGTTVTVEVQQTLQANVGQITVMDYVAEVFDKGYGWQQ